MSRALPPHRKLSNFEPRALRTPHAAAHRGDRLVDDTIAELLRLLKEHFGMDVVFASRVDDGPAHAFAPGAFAAAPIRLASGLVHGVLYYFGLTHDAIMGERETKRLEMSARLAARLIDGVEVHRGASLA
ncbi:hypothetical protein QTI66_14325 [Variovorax sp. J22R133]|uniref:hypothetical protein n=1 Tax=Variovorax brevis TaxID=3053503 RepID=UPI002574ACA9|nr:hypothetical protein [Variovorax sp. J22R133]MDM0113330.1 hypothetical protein [Variovorax sp. J22R133]